MRLFVEGSNKFLLFDISHPIFFRLLMKATLLKAIDEIVWNFHENSVEKVGK